MKSGKVAVVPHQIWNLTHIKALDAAKKSKNADALHKACQDAESYLAESIPARVIKERADLTVYQYHLLRLDMENYPKLTGDLDKRKAINDRALAYCNKISENLKNEKVAPHIDAMIRKEATGYVERTGTKLTTDQATITQKRSERAKAERVAKEQAEKEREEKSKESSKGSTASLTVQVDVGSASKQPESESDSPVEISLLPDVGEVPIPRLPESGSFSYKYIRVGEDPIPRLPASDSPIANSSKWQPDEDMQYLINAFGGIVHIAPQNSPKLFSSAGASAARQGESKHFDFSAAAVNASQTGAVTYKPIGQPEKSPCCSCLFSKTSKKPAETQSLAAAAGPDYQTMGASNGK